ncbi:MAG: hypothetical protein R2712_23530 [Vicinamibacterales bacterium]
MTGSGPVSAVLAAVAVLLTGAPAQRGPAAPVPDEERRLVAALDAAPASLERYEALADYYRRQGEAFRADDVLRSALSLDPASRRIFEQRIALFMEPFRWRPLGAVADEWLTVDGNNVVPVLIAAGARLRRASSSRGDGTDAAARELDAALTIIDAARPANPDAALLLMARSSVLLARATVEPDAERRETLADQAQRSWRDADDLAALPDREMTELGASSAAVAAMGQVPPFGPPGARRVGGGIAEPRLITQVLPRQRRLSPGERRTPVRLELVVDPGGRVIQVHAVDSVDHFDTVLAESVARWQYEPPLVDGRPATVILDVIVSR